uniref:Uncharacterized protein n=1 Tax=Hanusia phi TaxID=3032 RepID=A0A7S0HY99_9CRYP
MGLGCEFEGMDSRYKPLSRTEVGRSFVDGLGVKSRLNNYRRIKISAINDTGRGYVEAATLRGFYYIIACGKTEQIVNMFIPGMTFDEYIKMNFPVVHHRKQAERWVAKLYTIAELRRDGGLRQLELHLLERAEALVQRLLAGSWSTKMKIPARQRGKLLQSAVVRVKNLLSSEHVCHVHMISQFEEEMRQIELEPMVRHYERWCDVASASDLRHSRCSIM